MNGSLSYLSFSQKQSSDQIEKLQRLLISCSLVNLFIVAIMGVLLRSFPFITSFPLDYKNILHGHSHFAFGGWVMPALLGLLLKNFPALQQRVTYKYWRNISFILLLSAYGMLIAFPLQGYKAVSIIFSTLSILGGFYLAVVIWKVLPSLKSSVALRFLKAGLFYLVISAIGPFATGPLIAMGRANTPLYFDVIYFYLHFQYNGWFLFSVLALFYQFLEQHGRKTRGLKVFWLLNLACAPSYFLSILWHQPSIVFNVIGGMSATLQCVALIYLFYDIRNMQLDNKLVKTMIHLSLVSLFAKMVLQLLGAFPSLAALAYHQRNFVIAYLHLVLLGVISLFLMGWIIKSFSLALTRHLQFAVVLFIAAFLFTEALIVAWPLGLMMHYNFPHYSLILLLFSFLLPIGIGLFGWSYLNNGKFEASIAAA